jgi:Polysaccharide deacetylase
MNSIKQYATRRQFLQSSSVAAAGILWSKSFAQDPQTDPNRKGQIAITLDLEMARNFPDWSDTHWDFEKGNLTDAAKQYTVQACRRVHSRGGRIHTFVVGQVFEQENVDWLKEIAAEGHPIGNHTYDHVYLLAKHQSEIQFKFQRAPWLIAGREISDVIRENIVLTNIALKERIGVDACGFRTPGGFATGLHGREDLQEMLLGIGFKWISCTYPAHEGLTDLHGSDQLPSDAAYENIMSAQPKSQPFKYPTGLLDIPMSPISDIGAFRNGRWKLDYFLKAVQMAVEWAIRERAVFDFLAHPSCLGVVDPEFRALDLICDLVDRSDGAAEITTLDTIAHAHGA